MEAAVPHCKSVEIAMGQRHSGERVGEGQLEADLRGLLWDVRWPFPMNLPSFFLGRTFYTLEQMRQDCKKGNLYGNQEAMVGLSRQGAPAPLRNLRVGCVKVMNTVTKTLLEMLSDALEDGGENCPNKQREGLAKVMETLGLQVQLIESARMLLTREGIQTWQGQLAKELYDTCTRAGDHLHQSSLPMHAVKRDWLYVRGNLKALLNMSTVWGDVVQMAWELTSSNVLLEILNDLKRDLGLQVLTGGTKFVELVAAAWHKLEAPTVALMDDVTLPEKSCLRHSPSNSSNLAAPAVTAHFIAGRTGLRSSSRV